ncbi:MAG: hypothetical protein ACPL25_06630 [Ignavibacteria bacterium]
MKQKLFVFISALIIPFIILSCKSSVNEPDYLDDVILSSLIDNEESIYNFDENFDDGDATAFIVGKIQTDLYPIKVGRRITKIERSFDKQVVGDSAKVTVTSKYTGYLIIAGKFTRINPGDTTYLPDTIITKPFVETVKRNLTFIRTNSRNDRNRGWKIQAISLPEGSTSVRNIQITKVETIIPGKDTLIITSPLDTYFFIGDPMKDLPTRKRNDEVTLRVYLTSTSSKDDFVTINYGKKMAGQTFKVKRKLNLVSSVQVGDKWEKIYEGNWNIFVAHPMGRFHSVINAVTNETIFTVEGNVSSSTWGIPYKVN